MANSISFDGIDLAGADYGVTLMETPVPLFSKPRVREVSIPQRFGGWTEGGRGSILHMRCRVAVQGTDYSNLREKLDNISYLLRPEQGEKKIQFDFIPDRYWNGRVFNEIASPIIGQQGISFDLEFVCQDPNAFATSETVQNASITASPQTVYVPDGSGNTTGGTVPTFPVIEFEHTGSTGNSTTSIRIVNETTGHDLQVDRSFIVGEKIRVNSEVEIIEYHDGTEWEQINRFRDNERRRFPNLLPRVQNEFTIYTTGDNQTLDMSITYRNRYRS